MYLMINNAPPDPARIEYFLQQNCIACPFSPSNQTPNPPKNPCDIERAVRWSLDWQCALSPYFRKILFPNSHLPAEVLLSSPPYDCPFLRTRAAPPALNP